MNFITKVKNYELILVVCLLFVYNIAHADTPVTIYTPEGRAVIAYIMSDGTPWYTDEMANDDIDRYGLDAEIIETATAFYNCHGYAWAKSENIGTYWVGYTDNDEEIKFFSDGAWSNDGQASYLSASASVATHGCYEQYKDHSIRVIQNGYPIASSGSKTHVSKWGSGPLVRHAPGHDVYALKDPNIISYYKLKTTHNGTLSNYPKTWIGAGGITHTLSGNVTVPSGVTLKIMPKVTVKSQSGVSLYINGTLKAEGTASSQVTSAINTARNHVTTTGGLAIIYFPEGTYYLTSTITLTQNERNIVFQGAGSDKTTLVFQNMKNSSCFALTGILQ